MWTYFSVWSVAIFFAYFSNPFLRHSPSKLEVTRLATESKHTEIQFQISLMSMHIWTDELWNSCYLWLVCLFLANRSAFKYDVQSLSCSLIWPLTGRKGFLSSVYEVEKARLRSDLSNIDDVCINNILVCDKISLKGTITAHGISITIVIQLYCLGDYFAPSL